MLYMIGLAGVLCVLGFLPDQYGLRQKNHKLFLIVSGTLIILMMGLRSQYVGTGDTRAYVRHFERILLYDSFGEYYDARLAEYDFMFSESGFYLMVWYLTRITSNPQVLIFVTSFFITVATCRFIYKNSTDGFLSLLIYVCLGLFTFNMNGMRQAMAMSVCLFAFERAKKRKLISFVLLVLIAMQFHKTAICFLPVFLLPIVKPSRGNIIMYIFGMIFIMLSMESLIGAYNDLSGEEYLMKDAATGGGLFVLLIYLLPIVLSWIQPGILENRNISIALFAVIAGLGAYILRFFSNVIMERISYYYFYFTILLIPETVNNLDDREGKVVRWIFIVFAVLLFGYRTLGGSFRNFTLNF